MLNFHELYLKNLNIQIILDHSFFFSYCYYYNSSNYFYEFFSSISFRLIFLLLIISINF